MTLITKARFKINRTKEHGSVQLTLDILYIEVTLVIVETEWIYVTGDVIPFMLISHPREAGHVNWLVRHGTWAASRVSAAGACSAAVTSRCGHCSQLQRPGLGPDTKYVIIDQSWAKVRDRHCHSHLVWLQSIRLSHRNSELFNHVVSRIGKDRSMHTNFWKTLYTCKISMDVVLWIHIQCILYW